jgi:HicB-like protein involved in pilus formation
MNISIVIESLKEDLSGVAELGDERTAGVARRLSELLGSALRLRMLDVLSQAALELSSKLPSGHVEVRLAGQDPEFVFVEDEGAAEGGVGEELSARITLRLPEGLKQSIEQAAAREGVSVNTWLVRAMARSVDSRGPGGHPHRGGRRMTGYGQS